MKTVVIKRDLISRKKVHSGPQKSKKQRECKNIEADESWMFSLFYYASYTSLSAMYDEKMTKSQLCVR